MIISKFHIKVKSNHSLNQIKVHKVGIWFVKIVVWLKKLDNSIHLKIDHEDCKKTEFQEKTKKYKY